MRQKNKIVIMIPARLGSQRILLKALQPVHNRFLTCYIIDVCKEVVSDWKNIYLNASESVFESIAKQEKINYYKRPDHLSSSSVTNNEYIYDFLKNIPCDYVIQANLTSPFLTKKDISGFIKKLTTEQYDLLFSVKEIRSEALYDNKPLTFSYGGSKQNSQNIKPLHIICWGLTGIRSKTFIKNYEQDGKAIFGHKGDKIGYYLLSGLSTIDIDYPDDLELTRLLMKEKKQ
ncbi:MAG: hypothetical protein QXL17_03710 [Candidatus Thermoplasmatota archaeon]